MAEMGHGGGGGVGVLERQKEGYGGGVTHLVFDFEACCTTLPYGKSPVSNLAAEGELAEIRVPNSDGQYVTRYIKLVAVRALLDISKHPKHYSVYLIGPNVNHYKKFIDSNVETSLIEVIDQSPNEQEYQVNASALSVIPCSYMMSLVDKFENMDGAPVVLATDQITQDLINWTTRVRVRTAMVGLDNPEFGISGNELNRVMELGNSF